MKEDRAINDCGNGRSGDTGVSGARRAGLAQACCVIVILGLIWFLYGIHGNNQEFRVHGRSAILWMVKRWGGVGGDLAHGWIIPIVSAFVIWRKRQDLTAVPKETNTTGMVVIILSLLLHWLGFRAQLTRMSLVSLIGLLWGIPFYLYGRQVARILAFPCAYLIFCIPMSFLNNVTVPLRILASSIATHLLNGVCIPAVRSGTMIRSLAAGGFNLDVADPCSGLRSLIAMTAVTAVYAYFTQSTLLKKWLLFAAAIPLAIAGNIVRIVTIALVAESFGSQKALRFCHNFSGFVIFSVAIVLMMGLGRLLQIDYGERLREWRSRHTNLISSSLD